MGTHACPDYVECKSVVTHFSMINLVRTVDIEKAAVFFADGSKRYTVRGFKRSIQNLYISYANSNNEKVCMVGGKVRLGKLSQFKTKYVRFPQLFKVCVSEITFNYSDKLYFCRPSENISSCRRDTR